MTTYDLTPHDPGRTARDHSAWATPLERALPDIDRELVDQARVARHLLLAAKPGAALEILWSLLIQARRRQDRPSQAFVLLHMGHVYRVWMWDMAKRFYREGLDLARSCGYTVAEAVACWSEGELLLAWGEPRRAIPLLECSIELAGASASIKRLALLELAACRESLGEPSHRLRERAAALQPAHVLGVSAPVCPTCGCLARDEANGTSREAWTRTPKADGGAMGGDAGGRTRAPPRRYRWHPTRVARRLGAASPG